MAKFPQRTTILTISCCQSDSDARLHISWQFLTCFAPFAINCNKSLLTHTKFYTYTWNKSKLCNWHVFNQLGLQFFGWLNDRKTGNPARYHIVCYQNICWWLLCNSSSPMTIWLRCFLFPIISSLWWYIFNAVSNYHHYYYQKQ